MNRYMSILIVGAVAFISSCADSESMEQGCRSVVTTRPCVGNMDELKVFSGVVREKAGINLGFKTPGQLEYIYVREGDYVSRGQLLARLDDSDYRLGVEAAEAQYDQLNNELQRMRVLFESKNISANDYEKAEYGLKQLAVQLQNSRNKVEYTALTSPADGYIESVNFEVAEMVDAGTPVFKLITSGPVKVELGVPHSLYERRAHIKDITIRSAGQEIHAEMMSMLPKPDATHLHKTLLSADSPVLSPGKNVEVVFRMAGEESDVVMVPAGAVVNKEGRTWVWVLSSDSTVCRREVSLGDNPVAGKIVVESGLDGSEEIVRAGANSLDDGEKVIVVEPVSSTNIGGLI